MLLTIQDDDLVLPQWAQKGYDKLAALGVKGSFRLYPGLPHSASDKELADVLQFLHMRVPDRQG